MSLYLYRVSPPGFKLAFLERTEI